MKNGLSVLAATAILSITVSFAFASLHHPLQPQAQKQFVLLMKPTGPEFFKKTQEADGQQMVERHFKKLQALTQQGICLFSGHTLVTNESGFGIIVVNANTEADAQRIIDDDDLVRAGLVHGTIFPLQVVTFGK